MYHVARKLPPEKMTYKDTVTGLEITMLTTSEAKDDKIYQPHPNWTADSRHIVFISDRSGTNQYFAVSVKTGTIVQLTDDKQPGDACLSKKKNRMYYVSDNKIWNLDIDLILQSNELRQENEFRREVTDLPENTKLSGTISLDNNEKDIYLGVQYTADSWGLLL
jgi:Tol biopolymer transport system component